MGTQLKLMLTFDNGLKALFKPQWYSRTMKIQGPVYHGKDRHNAEVVAFYLALLLSFRRVPLALTRKCKIICISTFLTHTCIHIYIYIYIVDVRIPRPPSPSKCSKAPLIITLIQLYPFYSSSS